MSALKVDVDGVEWIKQAVDDDGVGGTGDWLAVSGGFSVKACIPECCCPVCSVDESREAFQNLCQFFGLQYRAVRQIRLCNTVEIKKIPEIFS